MSQAGNRKEGSEKPPKKQGSKTNLGAQPQTEEERLAREREMIDALNRQQIHKYLMSLEPNLSTDMVAGRVIGNSNI